MVVAAAPEPDEEKFEKSANESVALEAFAEAGAVVEGGGDVMKLNADPPFTAAAGGGAVVTVVAAGGDEIKLKEDPLVAAGGGTVVTVVATGGGEIKLKEDPLVAAGGGAVVTVVAAGGGEMKLKEEPLVGDAIGLEAVATGGGASTVAELGAIDAVAAAEKLGLKKSVELPAVGAEGGGDPNASKFAWNEAADGVVAGCEVAATGAEKSSRSATGAGAGAGGAARTGGGGAVRMGGADEIGGPAAPGIFVPGISTAVATTWEGPDDEAC